MTQTTKMTAPITRESYNSRRMEIDALNTKTEITTATTTSYKSLVYEMKINRQESVKS